MISHYWYLFLEIIEKPFQITGQIWGIVPIYFGWFMNELTPSKANFRTAIQTGFAFIWASAQWLYPYFAQKSAGATKPDIGLLLAVNVFVSVIILVLGIVAFISGLRGKFPPYGRFLGYTRFSNYFMIAIFPIQARSLEWTWERLIAIVIFAVPIWLVLHFGLMPVRNRK